MQVQGMSLQNLEDDLRWVEHVNTNTNSGAYGIVGDDSSTVEPIRPVLRPINLIKFIDTPQGFSPHDTSQSMNLRSLERHDFEQDFKGMDTSCIGGRCRALLEPLETDVTLAQLAVKRDPEHTKTTEKDTRLSSKALKWLRSIIKNIIKDPTNDKYRKLRKANPNIDQLLKEPRAKKLLEEVGFVDMEGNADFLYMKEENVNIDLLNGELEKLKVEEKQLEAADSAADSAVAAKEKTDGGSKRRRPKRSKTQKQTKKIKTTKKKKKTRKKKKRSTKRKRR